MEKKYIKKLNESLDLMRRMGEEVELLKEDSNRGPIKISDYFDISSISEEDIKSITNDMRAFLQGRGFGNAIFWNGDNVITEESQKTLSFDKLHKELIQLGFQPWQVVSKIYANGIKVAVLYADIAKNTDVIIKEMLSYGWTKAHISAPMVLYGVVCRVMDFDPIEQPSITNNVHEYEYIYHSTPSKNIDSIMKNGIEARSDNDYLDYPPRAHYMKGSIGKNEAALFTWQLFNTNKTYMDGDYAILRIRMNSVPETVEFYGDPRYPTGIFTKETILPKALELFGRIKFSDKNKYRGEKIQVLVPDDTMAELE